MHPAPGVAPIIEHLAAERMAADALDVRGPFLDPVERVAAARLVLAGIDRWPDERDFRQLLHAVDNLDLEPVRVREAHALAAARLVNVLDFRGALGARQLVEIFD